MKVEITVPAMGESVTEAVIAEIYKGSGSAVSMDEELLELETDKVNQPLYATHSGKVELLVSEGDTVSIGQVIGTIDSNGAAAPEGKQEAKSAEKAEKQEAKEKPKEKEAPKEKEKPKDQTSPVASLGTASAVRISKEQHLASLEAAPVETAAKAQERRLVAPHSVMPPVDGRPEKRKRMSGIRKLIAKRMLEAQSTTATLTTFNEVDLSRVIELRQKHKDRFLEKHGVKLGFMSFFVSAVVRALKEVPGINSYIDDEHIVEREYYDIGIAVSSERGLVVPVLRDCDKLSFAQIEASIMDFAKRAREGGLKVEELSGGGFTITNGGVFGSMLSTPILNPPQSGILGMHTIQKRAVVVDDQIVIRPMMYVALSYDHRVVDGKEAVTFLVKVKEALESPSTFLMDI